jgi:hypothetical protein
MLILLFLMPRQPRGFTTNGHTIPGGTAIITVATRMAPIVLS